MPRLTCLLLCCLTLSCARPPAAPPVIGAARASSPAVVTTTSTLPALPAAAAAVESDRGEARHLGEIRQLTALGRNGDARFSLDGERLFFQSRRAPGADECLLSIGTDGRGARFVRGAPCPATGVAPLEQGLVFSRREDLGAEVPAGAWGLVRLIGAKLTPLTTPPALGLRDARDAVFAPEAGLIFFSAELDGQRDLFARSLDGAQALRITSTREDEGAPAPSPDGGRVAFWRATGAARSEIFLLDRASGKTHPLTALGARSWAPAMHPDGERVLFGSGCYGELDHELLLVDARTAQLERVTYQPGYDGLPAFDPAGRRVAWTSSRHGGVPQIYVADWID